MDASATNDGRLTPLALRSRFSRKNRSIRTRLIACFVLIVLLMIAADAVAVWQFIWIAAVSQRLSNADETSLAVLRVHFDIDSFRGSVDLLAGSRDARQFTSEATSIRQKFLHDVDYARQLLSDSFDAPDATISTSLESLRVTLLSQLDTAVELANAGEWTLVRLRLTTQVPALMEYSSSLVDRVDQRVLEQRTKAFKEKQRAQQRLIVIVPLVGLLTLLSAAALGWYVTKAITGPLFELTACAESLAQGDFQNRFNVRGDDELTVLGKAFNYAALHLQGLYENLRRSEQELRDLIDAVPAHVWRASTDGAVDFINERLQQFVGLPREDILGWNWESVLHPDDRGRFVSEWRAAVKDGRSNEQEVRVRRVDGQYRWFHARNVPLRNDAGNVVKWYGTGIEIEDRKRAEEERKRLRQLEAELEREKLHASEEQLAESNRLYRELQNREAKVRRLVDANIVGVLIWDLDGRILEANDAFLRMVGYQREDLLSGGLRWTDLTPPEWRGGDATAIAELKLMGTAQPFEKELFRKNGIRVPVLLGAASLETGGNDSVAFVLDLSELKHSEEALLRSESYLAQAQRLAHIGSWVWEVTHRSALYLSDEWYRIYGFDAKDGMPSWEKRLQRVHPEDRAQWREAIDRAIAEKSDYDVQFRILNPGAAIRFIRSVGRPVLSSSGELLQFVGVAMDVTEQKHAEEALRSSEAYLMESQRLTHTGSCAIDGTSREILYWSDEMFRIYGFDPEQGLPNWDQWVQRIHPEDREKFRIAGDRTFLEKVLCDAEFRIVKPNGTVKYIHGIGHPVLGTSGELVQVIGTMVDITERKRAEESLRRSESYLAQAQRLAQIGSWAWETPGKHPLYLSEEWYRIYGFDPKVGMPSWEQELQRVHPEDRARFQANLERAITEKSAYDLEFRIVPPHTPIRFIRSLGQPVMSASGELLRFVGVSMDTTERKQAEQERERVRQLEADFAHMSRVNMMGHLTASLAHEINQPIGAALGNAEACFHFLHGEHPDVAEAREAALEMATDVRRAASIVERVRSLYRKGPSRKEIVDINEVIKEMVLMLESQASRHSVTIRTELAEKLPKVPADRVQLQQVMMNLMLNAIEAMQDPNGELSIKSELSEEGQLLITVIDTGVGLPASNADQIFNAFFTTKSQGTGLGLAITRSIIESHGGRVWATANRDRGATFHFTLPSKRAKTV